MLCAFLIAHAVWYALGPENYCFSNLYVGTTVFVENSQQQDEFKLIN